MQLSNLLPVKLLLVIFAQFISFFERFKEFDFVCYYEGSEIYFCSSFSIFVAFILEAFMLQYSFSKTKYEAALEKKIEETGAGSER